MNNALPLNQKNLDQFGALLPIPTFNRSAHKVGIVHIGVGSFHRSHQAYYIHKLQEKFNAPERGICGIGLRKDDKKISDILKKQDHLYTLLVGHNHFTGIKQIIYVI